MSCRALSCDSKPTLISFRQCPPRMPECRQWVTVHGKGVNDEVVLTPRKDLVETVLLHGRARVTGEYKCTSTCTGSSATKRVLVTGLLNFFWFFWFFLIFLNFFLNFFNNIFTDVADGFELKMNVSGNPVTAEPFGLHCGVSLYNYTTDIAWFLTSSAGISRRIGNATVLPGADFSKKKNGMDLAMGCFNFVSLVAGMSMSYPNRTYSYVEMLNWSKIPKSAGGKYACQATSLDGVKINQTVSFTVQSISLAWLKTKNWIIDNNWTDRRALMIYNVTRANVEVEKGNEILLFCHATGLPVPRSKWLKVLRDPMIQVFDDFDWFWVCRTVLK